MLSELTVSLLVLAGVFLHHFVPFARKLVGKGLFVQFLDELVYYIKSFGKESFSDNIVYETKFLGSILITSIATWATGTGIFSQIDITNYYILGFIMPEFIISGIIMLVSVGWGYFGKDIFVGALKWVETIKENRRSFSE